MSVILNEVALVALLESPTGPVGRDLEKRANIVAGNGEAVVNLILEDPEIRPAVDYSISADAEGLRAVVGLKWDGQRTTQYMADKWERESDWIVPALFTGWDA